MESEYTRLAEIISKNATVHSKKRFIVAIAGIPGSGKTTTASALVKHLNAAPFSTRAAILSMDGFHLPRSTLDQLPNREEAYLRRGAPFTFDASGFVAFVRQLRDWADNTPFPSSESPKTAIYGPSFDHQAKDPVDNGMEVASDATIIIIEGLYLLLDEPEWRDVADLVDYRIFVDADMQEARDRVAKRHVQAGIERTLEGGYRRFDSNDVLNGVMIREKLIAPDMVIQSVTE